MLVTGKISFVRALLYIIVQCAGAVAGTASLKSLLPEIYHNGLGHTTLAIEVTPVQGLGIEFFLGFILIFTVFGVCDDNKAGKPYANSTKLTNKKTYERKFIFFQRFQIYRTIGHWTCCYRWSFGRH